MILDIDSSLGYPEIGALLSGVLFGIFTMQVYIYHKNFPNDQGWIKFGLVDSMWFFELAHTICEFYGLYYVTVFHYGDPTIFLAVPHELAAVPLFDGLIATIDQWRWLIIIACLFPIAIDIILSTALVYNLIKNAIPPAAETGVVTSSVSIIVMICFLINPTNFLWVAFYAVLPKFTELITIPLPGTTAQSLEVRTNLPETPHVPSESIIQEGHQFEIKALPVTQD
ncbi:hypothetical protein EV359DRAFT_68610 [Lentinula novae-zelandiae]|nr:hypothetical protein EV359DRAFT_68610 [Lentinula novae-zelandiae]